MLRRLDMRQARQCLDRKRLAFVSGRRGGLHLSSALVHLAVVCHDISMICGRERPLQVGDSLTRYQYLSLAHFLARGVWPER